jgi:hypothetical protein
MNFNRAILILFVAAVAAFAFNSHYQSHSLEKKGRLEIANASQRDYATFLIHAEELKRLARIEIDSEQIDILTSVNEGDSSGGSYAATLADSWA